jgi:IS1 family transposase
MNQLSLEKRTQIIQQLVEGSSLRATSRITGASRTTIIKLLEEVGKACIEFHDKQVRNLQSRLVQCDEIWSFVYAKEKNAPDEKKADGAGDVWTWVGIDSETKLVISWFVGNRDAESGSEFMHDVAGRVANRIQLTTDGHRPYLKAVDDAFGMDIDFAQLVKIYGGAEGTGPEKRYSPAECTGAKQVRVSGHPDKKHISTSHIERQNLTMRMHMRRFTRLTNAFSKKIENHAYAIALHFVYYNFVKIHQTLRVAPAMEAKLIDRLWDISDIVKLADKN